jgi:hypothetical protein
MPEMDIKPAFQAEKVTGRFTRTVMHIQEEVREVGPLKDKKIITRKLVPVVEEFSEGWMVYFPQKHSIFIAADDEDQLRSIGILESPPLVDMNSGEIVPKDYNLSPKELVQQAELRSRGRSTGGFTALDQGVIE